MTKDILLRTYSFLLIIITYSSIAKCTGSFIRLIRSNNPGIDDITVVDLLLKIRLVISFLLFVVIGAAGAVYVICILPFFTKLSFLWF